MGVRGSFCGEVAVLQVECSIEGIAAVLFNCVADFSAGRNFDRICAVFFGAGL